MAAPWPEAVFVLIPAYKAAVLLESLLPRVLSVVPASRVLVVNDASFDTTNEVCAKYRVAVAEHEINRGKGAALVTGFGILCKQDASWIITMDADGQHSPDDLNLFSREISSRPTLGIAIGTRAMQPGIMPLERILSNRLTSSILSLFCGVSVNDSQCGYRIYNCNLLKHISIRYHRFEMESEIIMKAAFTGFTVTFIPIQTLYLNGPSHISHIFDTLRWIKAVITIRIERQRIINAYHESLTKCKLTGYGTS